MGKNNDIDGFDPSELIDKEEEIVNIDTERIDNDSLKEAEDLIENLKDIYADPEFMKANPKFATRLKAEMEDLRILIKIRKSDEVAHDVLLAAIGRNSSNASLYRSLSDIQKTILSTTSELSTKIKDINSMLKTIQLEINFKPEPNEENVDKETGEIIPSAEQNTFRGSKDFIKAMREEMGDAVDD
jgi:hypothetical protein